MTVAPALLSALDALRAAPHESAVFCDVDGTLAPIVARPEDARLVEGATEALTAVGRRMRLLAFVSGRAVGDAMALVGLDEHSYAGNHGMEVRHPGAAITLAPGVTRHLPAIGAFAAQWPAERVAAAGVRLENKGATLSYHVRGVADRGAAERLLDQLTAAAQASGLIAKAGREVLEIRPGVRIDKGTAVRALLARAGVRRAVYFGDDLTDVDAWRALGELRAEGVLEVTVTVAVVSPEVPASVSDRAEFHLADPSEVVTALTHLAAPTTGAISARL